ncbi:very short patch repair endonuclease [Candidatus Palauibacter sp.]|uniref:very short patch repair endonuclease n=1 Tax=Candidatus Palauibacter sp. TaxID=3101350 RepID=UPI003B01D08D
MDRITPETRSRVMSRIRAKDTSPEMTVRRYLHARGFRFRLHRHDLPGRPDLVLPKYATVVQVYGCFWHQHPDPSCRDARLPKSNREYWIPKLERTRRRDRRNQLALEALGWNVEIIWACEISDARLEKLTDSIRRNVS